MSTLKQRPTKAIRLLLITCVLCAGLLALLTPIYAQEPAPSPTPSPTLPLPSIPPDQVLTGIVPDLPPGYMIIEGDIQVPIAEFERRYSQFQSDASAASPDGAFETNLWPSGIVPYEFDGNVTAISQTLMIQAMGSWENARDVNVTFTRCGANNCSTAGITAYLHVQHSSGNNSAVGRTGGRQIVNIYNWNWQFIMAHELGHALGLEHEQSRRDRDHNVRINWDNICKDDDTDCNGGFCFNGIGERIDCDYNFLIEQTSLTYVPYDYDSVMHYGRDSFSRFNTNGVWADTITVLPPRTNAIGQRTHLSTFDAIAMECMYPPAGWRYLTKTGTAAGTGICAAPFNSFPGATGVNGVPVDGVLVVGPGNYAAVGTYSRRITVRATHGIVSLGNY